MKKSSIITLPFIFIVTAIYTFTKCPIDKWLYVGCAFLAVGLMVVTYNQIKKIEKLSNILDLTIIENKKKGGV